MRPLIFISGRPFAFPQSGVEQRTKLMADVLASMPGNFPRCLLVPCATEEEQLEYAKSGWEVCSLPVLSKVRNQMDNLLIGLLGRLSLDRHDELLRVRGGSVHLPMHLLRAAQDRFAGALVWVYRSDYWNLVRCRRPGEFWIMDTNDSIWNLQRFYGWNMRTRRWLWPSQDRFTALIQAKETKWPARYDLVIAICRRDEELFRDQMEAPNVVLYDSCVAGTNAPDKSPAGERDIMVGYLGADHSGSIEAARRLIDLAGDGRFGDAELVLAGNCGLHLPESGPGFRNIGPVADARAFWQRVRFAVLPLPQKTGISVKFQEAVLGGARVLARRGAVEWSKATLGIDYVEFDDWTEIPGILGRWPASREDNPRLDRSFGAVTQEIRNIIERAKIYSL